MSKKYAIAISALLGLGAASLSYAEGMGTTSSTENKTVTTKQESTQVQQPTDMKWTELKGKVENINLTANTLQIKEKGSDKLIEVPITPQIRVMDSSNHQIALGDLKQGQKVILRNEPQS